MENLFDDYLIKYVNTKENNYLKHAITILLSCGFDEKTSNNIIETEIDIIKYRHNLKYPIIDSYFWLDRLDYLNKNNIGGLIENKNDYLLLRHDKPAMISHDTLTLSELCLLFDEAYYIYKFRQLDVCDAIFNECSQIAKNESLDSWVIREFRTRIEEIYLRTIKDNGTYTFLHMKKQIDTLYKHELAVLFTRRKYNRQYINN